VNACAAQELLIDTLPEGASREGVLYSDGAYIKDLKEVRDLHTRCSVLPSHPVYVLSFSSLFLTQIHSCATTFSWCTRTTGRKRISFSSTTVVCCTLPLVYLRRIRCVLSISATLLCRMIRWDIRRRM
jgi:hypothetical protein